MRQPRQETIATYNRAASELAEYFDDFGPRISDIDQAFEFAGNPKAARVLEIGCAYGRDAKEITRRAAWYLGIDVSEGFIKIAREKVSEGNFQVADAITFEFPEDLDIVFAFASLLHMDKDEVGDILGRAHTALRPGGVFDISVKYLPDYTERVQEDQYGLRQYFYYNPELITELAGSGYIVRKSEVVEKIGEEWVEIFLQKNKDE